MKIAETGCLRHQRPEVWQLSYEHLYQRQIGPVQLACIHGRLDHNGRRQKLIQNVKNAAPRLLVQSAFELGVGEVNPSSPKLYIPEYCFMYR